MKIGDFNTDDKVLIIAEIGNNHEGDFEVAKKMVENAALSGVDAVKFQTFKTERYVSKNNLERFSKLKSFELSYSQFAELAHQAKQLGLLFLSTPFDLESADAISHFVDGIKIASGDNNFYPLIEKVACLNLPTILSLGLLEIEEVKKTVRVLTSNWGNKMISEHLAVLHCVCSYPVPEEEANLKALQQLQSELKCTVGYSDHVLGNQAALLSIALGARIVEKHFTLDKNLSDFRDHQMSADLEEMTSLVQSIRSAESMLGGQCKRMENCEKSLVSAVRRSIVITKDAPRGKTIEMADLSWVRPAGGIAPGNECLVLGKTLKKDLSAGEQITLDDLD